MHLKGYGMMGLFMKYTVMVLKKPLKLIKGFLKKGNQGLIFNGFSGVPSY